MGKQFELYLPMALAGGATYYGQCSSAQEDFHSSHLLCTRSENVPDMCTYAIYRDSVNARVCYIFLTLCFLFKSCNTEK